MPGHVLIVNQSSLVSAGTEKMIMNLAKKSLIGKAKERPDQVKRVLQKIRNEGLFNTVDAVFKKLDEPMTMGYSSAGIVLACGHGVQQYKPGDRVASNGPHAEVVSVPQNLCARIPESVSYESASFAVLGSIAMQGVRLSKLVLGETAFVIGLGLVGQLTVALLRSAGVRVIGTDLDPAKCELAIKMGAEIARPNLNASAVMNETGGLGADAVLITASTKSNGPIELAAEAVRQKGRVVLVGVVGLEIDRRPFYFKEAEFVVSCSYGPGRYDPDYEDRGIDYPAAYVRWTQQRNIQAVLDLMAGGWLNVGPLISHRFEIENATDAYTLIETGSEPYLGIVLNYPKFSGEAPKSKIQLTASSPSNGKIRFGVLGAGNFARMVMLPAIQKCENFLPATICSAKGVTGTHSGKLGGFESSTTDEEEIFNDDSINAVFSLTRHDQHARHVVKAIRSGKNIFVEKPLCLTTDELTEIESELVAQGEQAPVVMVGFNRRFSPAARTVKSHFANVAQPLTIMIRFNAGDIPADHWTQHDDEGGGRIIGEACHAIDLATYLAGSNPVRVYAESVATDNADDITDDQCFITIRHENGSISNIGYVSSGDKGFPKERIEVFGGGKVGVIDDFKEVTLSANGKIQKTKSKLDKGHQQEIVELEKSLMSGGAAPIPWNEIRATTLASIFAVRSLREGMPFDLQSVECMSDESE